jgi:hypothetical protein
MTDKQLAIFMQEIVARLESIQAEMEDLLDNCGLEKEIRKGWRLKKEFRTIPMFDLFQTRFKNPERFEEYTISEDYVATAPLIEYLETLQEYVDALEENNNE